MFIAFLLVLLPLRGWIGDAMAMDMLIQAHDSASVHAAPQGHVDCPEHAAMHSPADPVDLQAQPGADCGSCGGCQICHSAAMPALAALAPAPEMTPAALMPMSVRFASVAPAPGFKPPIF